MVKVIHVITDTNIGGAGRVLLQYLRHFTKAKFNLLVVLPKDSQLISAIQKLNISYIEIEHIPDKSFSFRGILALRKLFIAEKPDIVHTHASLSARIAAKSIHKQIPVVLTRHTVSAVDKRAKRFYKKWIHRWMNKRYVDKIIAVSPAAKENMLDEGTEASKIQVIMNGISPVEVRSFFENEAYKREIGISGNPFICALIARFEHIKGHEYMLDAAKILQTRTKDILFVVAGNGELEQDIRLRAKNMKLDNILFLGFVPEIQKLENIMDIQINTSFFEGTSISLLEGMSLGKPAVATDVGGNPYVILDGENGIIIPEKDGNALADAILAIEGDKKLYEQLSSQAFKVFGEKFTVDQMIEQMESMYEELLLARKGV